ncbi:hypothetical protein FRACA_170040 [Frankia canadensis]|uniref:Uncharacterized protein n=1 Tax=Frankia canadensis TaxID=1836972 RepID=A0A2I2KN41_9ACTN|nr:hypothetical protein [Frankia canadensis]SNQ47080.1 hypothetical protein FRACA_170040 [Frankia canadensis]SOU54370.1 hypothetical protein FRACA_170040 [Frankia canadensis]
MTAVPIVPVDQLEPTPAELTDARKSFADCDSYNDCKRELAIWAVHLDDLAAALARGDHDQAAHFIRIMRAALRVHDEWTARWRQSADIWDADYPAWPPGRELTV